MVTGTSYRFLRAQGNSQSMRSKGGVLSKSEYRLRRDEELFDTYA